MMNARIYIKILMVILLLGVTASCNHEDTIWGEDNQMNVSLTLKLGDQAIHVSRAAVADEGTENVVNTIELFIYKEDGTPVYISDGEITKSDNGEISFSMLVKDIEELGATPQVYAIVNRGDNALPSDYSIASLKQMVLRSTFAENGTTKAQESFVMAGLATVTCAGNALSGTIPVKRVAVKIGLSLVNADGSSAESLTVKDENGNALWTADKSDVQISLRRGSNVTYLASDEYVYTNYQDGDIFSIDFIELTSNSTFYTYPTNWTNNENARTHLMLSVNWTKANGSDEEKLTYYEINVNPAGSYTECNHYYQIEQEISVLGSEEEEEPLPLVTASYKVIPWQTAGASTGSLSRPRYLMVEETAITLQNVETKRIYFNSSDPIDLNSLTIKWNYTTNAAATDLAMADLDNAQKSTLDNGDIQYVVNNTANVSGVTNRIQGDYNVTITIHNADINNANDRSYIEVNHPLNNSMNEDSDYTRYFIDFGVQHQGDATYKETIKITQYPMISIVADQNSEFGGNVNNTSWGYVYVNGKNSTTTGSWERVTDGLTLNKCPNRYIVSVSTLTNTEIAKNYIIGDPRTDSRDITGVTGRDLSNYLPTNVDASTQNMISPQFMFASSYGACPSAMSKADAERRCATYQEDGYPAGRWRLPTEAEVKYAIQLKGWEIIPELFSSSMNYWSAHGSINGNAVNSGNGNNNTTAVVRCVYDTWYWGTEHTPGSTTYVYDDTRD